MYGDKDFFTITKSFHNALQGGTLQLTAETRQAYLDRNLASAEMLPEDYDLYIIHDPQPAALRHFKTSASRSKWIWRCHIDSSEPNQQVWEFLRPYIQEYDAAVFTMRAFEPADLAMKQVVFIPPAIDPVSPKNMELPADVCVAAVALALLAAGRKVLLVRDSVAESIRPGRSVLHRLCRAGRKLYQSSTSPCVDR
jgi:trehalose synthase